MSWLREIGPFLLTAIAVALVIPTGFVALDILDGRSSSPDFFLGIAAIVFCLAGIGGMAVGLPVWWIAKRAGWHRSMAGMAACGAIAGAAAAALLTIPFFGDRSFAMHSMPSWAAVGAIAGIMAGPIWVLLHSRDENAKTAA